MSVCGLQVQVMPASPHAHPTPAQHLTMAPNLGQMPPPTRGQPTRRCAGSHWALISLQDSPAGHTALRRLHASPGWGSSKGPRASARAGRGHQGQMDAAPAIAPQGSPGDTMPCLCYHTDHTNAGHMGSPAARTSRPNTALPRPHSKPPYCTTRAGVAPHYLSAPPPWRGAPVVAPASGTGG